MDPHELAFLPALELAAIIRSGDISPVEVVDTYLDRIGEIDESVSAFIAVAHDQARQDAKEAAATVASGAELGPLHGVPVAVKSVIETAGLYTTDRTYSAWAGRVPDYDAAVVSKLRDAGCIIIGKTKVTNILGEADAPATVAGIYDEPVPYRSCRNPWNLEHSPGWSSGGAGAALAAGLCSLSIGADDGGSVRIPSAWCGLFGIKPSRGRVSAAPDPAAPYYTPGPMAHTVADAAALLDVMSGYVTGDGFWAPPPIRPFHSEVGADPGRLRIAYTTVAADGMSTGAAPKAAVAEAAALLADLDHELVEVTDWPGRGMFPDDRVLGMVDIYGVRWAAWMELGLMPPEDELEPFMKHFVQQGRQVRAVDLMKATHLEAEMARKVVAFFDDYDLFLTPVMLNQPFRLDTYAEHPERAGEVSEWIQFTGQFSQSGQPAVSIPIDVDDLGLPVGVQLVGRPADEVTLIRAASQVELARPWNGRRAPNV
jgi:amidase